MSTRHASAERLLLIHPEGPCRDLLVAAAQREGFAVAVAGAMTAAIERLRHEPAFAMVAVSTAVVPAGRWEGDSPDAVSAVRTLSRQAGRAQLVVLAAHALDVRTSCELVRCGVSGFVDGRQEQWDHDAFIRQLRAAQMRYRTTRPATEALHTLGPAERNSMVCQSPIMEDLMHRAARAAQVSDVPILIYGESGTGKQLLAEMIHQLDPKRSRKRLLSVNCSAIAGSLAESTLFGHVRGAYTGAATSRKGMFRAAEGGTVLLDEIGEMELALQPKLLRVLQEHVVMPVGADEEESCDVRVIAATNRPLAVLVERGQFRLDLYQRLNVITLEIPPLRERREDIPELVGFFTKKYAGYYERPIESVDPRVIDYFTQARLDGNVRELENTIRQMLAFKAAGTRLELSDIPTSLLNRERRSNRDGAAALADLVDAASQLLDEGTMTLPELVSEYERLVLHCTLQRSNATSTDLAKRLGLSRRTLYNKIRKYQLSDHDREL
ncbi:MAG TPA: sigma-54 dependent transcriptional regulator [Phycisphaerae bacterium]|nr:sigma-54-dependent Fis family transcriptional regulator [Phycisphaerales bacterium]HRX84036.1 sigma-54 dependent transcriptional regulator [Phycisphaerae bacterium]